VGDPAHWDDRYRSVGSEAVSWYEGRPTASLETLAAIGVASAHSVIDVGGGASTLVDELLAAGHRDLTVLDLSAVAIDTARARVGDPSGVCWVEADILTWQPARQWDVWHDRAVLHFLVDDADRVAYRKALRGALAAGGRFVIATFAEDGPEQCSGLPVQRYTPDALASLLGAGFEVQVHRRDAHVTPAGAVQQFTWVAGRRAEN
jgi:SAM-dependent methyltransferase